MNYDIIVIGSGPGGYVAAIKASQLGAKVAIVEKNNFGGVCLNWGCIPTKTLLKNAKVYQYILNASKYGIDIPDPSSIKLNWGNMLSRKDNVIERLTSGVEYLLERNKVDIYRGFGRAIDKNSIEVNGKVIRCKNLIISGGIKTFLDGYYFIKKSKLPSIYGQASVFLEQAQQGYKRLKEFVQYQIKGLELANAYLRIRD